MLAVLSVVVGCATVLLVEGSLVYYRSSGAPEWLRRNPSLQATLSCLLSNGLVASLFIFGQFLVDSNSTPPTLGELVVIACVLTISILVWRKIRNIGNSLNDNRRKRFTVLEFERGPTVEPDPTPRPEPAPRKAA